MTEAVAMTKIPGIDTLQQVTPMLREFGVTITILFVLLFFGLSLITVFIFQFNKTLQSMDKQNILAVEQLRILVQGQIDGREYNRSSFHRIVNVLSKEEIKVNDLTNDINEIGLSIAVITEQCRANNATVHDISQNILEIFKRRNGNDNGNKREA